MGKKKPQSGGGKGNGGGRKRMISPGELKRASKVLRGQVATLDGLVEVMAQSRLPQIEIDGFLLLAAPPRRDRGFASE